MPAAGAPPYVVRKARKAGEILFYGALVGASRLFGFKARHRARDRRMLDEVILPALAADSRYSRVLSVGCDWYTEHVEDLFVSKGREYATLEIDEDRARHGAARHAIAPLSGLLEHHPRGSLDLILCNGVIGWGLNDPVEIEKSIKACVEALAPGGLLLLGWDDVPEKLPVPIGEIAALKALAPASPAGLEPVIRVDTYAKHTFGFFAKPSTIS
jgi:SAM-dependent methyltransferase